MSLEVMYTSLFFTLSILLCPRVTMQGVSMVPSSIVHTYTPSNPYQAHLVALFASTSELPLRFEVLKPALDLAVEEAQVKYPSISIHLTTRRDDRTCDKNYAASFAAEEYYKNKYSQVTRLQGNTSSQSYGTLSHKDLRPVTAFIGPACSRALDYVARLASYWNIPVFTAGGISVEFSNKKLYSTLTRLSFSLDRVSHFIMKILDEFNWHHISLVVDETQSSNRLLRKSLEEVIRNQSSANEVKFDVQPFSRLDDDGNMTNRTIDYKKILTAASSKARVIILAVASQSVRDILLEAYDLGMNSGEYAFIAIELIKESSTSSETHGWYRIGDRRNKEAREMFESLLQISSRVPTSLRFTSFVHEVAKRAQNEFAATIKSSDVNPVIAAFYDSIQVFVWTLNETLARGLDPSDARSLTQLFWNKTFIDGMTGDILIDENGDREADYTMNDLDPETGFMIPIATYFGARKLYEKLPGYEITWSAGQSKAPSDVPRCGFLGDDASCQESEFPLALVLTLSIIICVSLTSSISYLVIRKIRLEATLKDSWWRVNWSEIKFADKSNMKKSTTSLGTSQATLSSLGTGITTTRVSGGTSVASSMNTTAANISGVMVAMYKGVKVAVKELGVTKIQVTRELLVDIKMMRDFTHENLVRFIGICIEDPNYAVVTELATRGSLTDMLENESVKIDWIFKYSIISDIVEGMTYLHSSGHGYHGSLKSSNCVIDSRFTVKILNYGLKSLEDQRSSKYDDEETFNPRNLFWTAPEHLRTHSPLRSGSPKGDVYSFAIILHEIITRCSPFDSIERAGRKKKALSPDDILDRLKMGTIPPFRPEIAPDEAPAELIDLVQSCWTEDPNLRPDFSVIKPRLRKITKGVTSKNFLDNLLNRMEQYANNLEKIVEEKTEQMLEEKLKTEEILFSLLPKPIAEDLKRGSIIEPNFYDCVTIFFSDIEGFTSLSAESTPMQVVDLLNDLYTCFDGIIDNYDVFKVETIGDAYMVASGLPISNGIQHAKEISRMALNLRDAMLTFKIRHKPDRKLRIRMGIHSGPAVAGVVGTKMPKYVIFGETVNIASKMESHGEPTKVHISNETRQILESNFKSFKISLRGPIDMKGIGKLTTYWLDCDDKSK